MSDIGSYRPNQANYGQLTNRLGWLTTPTRKVLLSRHLLRTIGHFELPKAIGKADEKYLAQLVRCLLDCSLPPKFQTKKHSAPYQPEGRPSVYFLGRIRKSRFVSVETKLQHGGSEITYPLPSQESSFLIVSKNSPQINHADGILAFEIDRVVRGTNLTTKKIAEARCDELVRNPLWSGAATNSVDKAGLSFFRSIDQLSDGLSFWESWYQGLLVGTVRNWDVLAEVVNIPNNVWDDGLAAVAEAIRGIEARLLSEHLPQIEEVFQASSGLYDVRTSFSDPIVLIESIENRVRFALDLAVESNACDLNAMSTAAKVLRHALDNCLDDPNALEQFLRRASDMVKARMADGSFSNDDELDLLTKTLDEMALQLRADHPDVAAAVEARSEQSVRELADAKRLEGVKLIEDMREGTEARLHTELGLASETVQDGSSSKATADALKQSGHRAAKISISERAKKAEGSGAMSALKIGMRAEKLVEFMTNLISGGGVP